MIYVVVSEEGPGKSLAEALGAVLIESPLDSRQGVALAFAEAKRKVGAANAILHSALSSSSLESVPIGTLSYERWSEITHRNVLRTVHVMQAAREHFMGRGGSIIVFGPALSLVGAAGLAPLTMACEAQRTLVKAAARAWGSESIRVNWLAIDESHYPKLSGAPLAQAPELGSPPPALGMAPNISTDAAALISALAGSAGRVITGATINLDGGHWMTP